MQKDKFFDENTVIIVIIALFIGFIAGKFIPSGVFMPVRLFFHNIYVKLNPDSQKDSKTLIMEKVSGDIYLPQKSIFDEPVKKENKAVLYIKRILKKEDNSDNPKSIHDFILN